MLHRLPLSMLVIACLSSLLWAQAPSSSPLEPTITNVSLQGDIDGANLLFTLAFDITTRRTDQPIELLKGDVVIEQLSPALAQIGGRLGYDPTNALYTIVFASPGKRHVTLQFSARANPVGDTPWREAVFALPPSDLREVTLRSDRADLELDVPGAVRVDRKVDNSRLTITAVQGAQRVFTVRWKPQVQQLDAELVVAANVHTIASLGVASLRLDNVFSYDIAQGKLEKLALTLPPGLNVTAVRGRNIRDWRVIDVPDARTLEVVLNRAQTGSYVLQVVAEAPMPALPAELQLPVIEPQGVIRASGHLAVGTDHAIQMLVRQAAALSQIDAGAMPRIAIDTTTPRPLPRERAFFYNFTTVAYRLRLGLDRIVPAYDAAYRMVVSVSEDDLAIDAEVELDIRDAPIRDVTIDTPRGYTVVGVVGAAVDDYRVIGGESADTLRVQFKEQIIGRHALRLRLELGRSPLDADQIIPSLSVHNAKAQRGHVVVAVEDGIRVDPPATTGQSIREVNTASVPLRIATAQYAYRFRDIDWRLTLHPIKKAAGVRSEAFHLVSIGEGIVATSAAFSYFITGSPIDRFDFIVDPRMENVEFIGADVRRWDRDPADPSRWTVTLHRKVEGDFNLGLTFSQPLAHAGDGGETPIIIAAAKATHVETQLGYIALSSQLHVSVTPPTTPQSGLIEIDRDELPGNYRLLVSAPLLRSFKHVGDVTSATVAVKTYDRGELLPAVVEFTRIESWIVPEAGDRAESHTRVRYIVKNSREQFLTLKMPAGVEVWSARQLDQPDALASDGKRLSVVKDDKAGLLMVPIPRPRDPNAPITIEVEYGQVHQAPGWRGRIDVAAPLAGADSTFDQWLVHVPAEWSIDAAGEPSMLKPTSRVQQRGDLRALLHGVGASWGEAIGLGLTYPIWAVTLVVAAAVVVLAFLFRRRTVGDVTVGLILLVAVALGIAAAASDAFTARLATPDDLTTLTLTRVIDLKEGQPLIVEARVVPSWRQHLGIVSMVIVPAAAIACLIGSLFVGKRRGVLLALGVTGLLYSISRVPQATPWLGHALTWGLPALLTLVFLVRAMRRPRPATTSQGLGGAAVATASLLIAATLLGIVGCASTKAIVPRLDNVAITQLNATLVAEADAMNVELRIEAIVDKPARVPLLSRQSILLSVDGTTATDRLERSDDGYDLVMKAAGRHAMTIRCLMPMGDVPDETQTRRFEMTLPPAMRKSVSVTLPQTGVDVAATTAVRQQRREVEGKTVLDATLGPTDAIVLTWRPRERERARERTSFFASIMSVHRLDSGVISGAHDARLQIAQGQLDRLQLTIPADLTVTALQGEAIGTWRFDSTSRQLDVRLTRPASGDYTLRIFTQMPVGAMPFTATLGPLRVHDAVRQTSTVGLTASDSVFATVESVAPLLNADDFARDAAALIEVVGGSPAVRFAYRMDADKDRLSATLAPVEPELRVMENASFAVTDERLVYNGQVVLSLAKAGVFAVDLVIPEGYDIDALAAPQVGHWDESSVNGRRMATVHFTNRVLGDVSLQLTMSRPVAGLPPTLDVPRVEAVGALKHEGRVVITADRGVRLTVTSRSGVSELDAASAGIHDGNAIVFRLLRPSWSLQLATEQVEPRISVEALHVARVGDGLVRHTHHLRYALHHAGAKVFDLRLPAEATAILIHGPRIARVQALETPGSWRVELSGRWFDTDGLLPLTVQYETPYDRDAGRITLAPVRADAHLQRGYVAVFGDDRVELSAASATASLQSVDARTLPGDFGAGDQSSAALCYRATSGEYALDLHAARMPTAAMLDAEVQGATIDTVVTEHGQTINDVLLQLRVAGKRDLHAYLPAGAEVWSLMVNGRSTVPSLQTGVGGRQITLIPLAQTASGDLPVEVQIVYVTPASAASRWSHPRLEGPRFDLPLKNVAWRLFVPDDYAYDDFEGTLNPVRDRIEKPVYTHYDVSAYNRQNALFNSRNLQKAMEAQNQAAALAQQGQQKAARQQLESAWYYSQSDIGLNEDARVQLHRLAREQALVGLLGNRGRLRQQYGAADGPTTAELGEEFSQAQVQRLRGGLAKFDSDNLDLICGRIVDAQQAVAAAPVALAVSIPFRGRMIEFHRAIQVEPDAPMHVSFTAKTPRREKLDTAPVWAMVLFAVLLVGFGAVPWGLRRIDQWGAAAASSDADTQNGQ